MITPKETPLEKHYFDVNGYCEHGVKHIGIHTCDGCCEIKFPKNKQTPLEDKIKEERQAIKIIGNKTTENVCNVTINHIEQDLKQALQRLKEELCCCTKDKECFNCQTMRIILGEGLVGS